MTTISTDTLPLFHDSPVVAGNEDFYVTMPVAVIPVLESWRRSLFSYEWLAPDLSVKPLDALPERAQAERVAIEAALREGRSLAMPVLGIGLMDNVEIGSGKAVFLTLAAAGAKKIPVHIRAAHTDDFKVFADGV